MRIARPMPVAKRAWFKPVSWPGLQRISAAAWRFASSAANRPGASNSRITVHPPPRRFWHTDASASSGFQPRRERGYARTVENSEHLAGFAARHRPFYEALFAERLVVP